MWGAPCGRAAAGRAGRRPPAGAKPREARGRGSEAATERRAHREENKEEEEAEAAGLRTAVQALHLCGGPRAEGLRLGLSRGPNGGPGDDMGTGYRGRNKKRKLKMDVANVAIRVRVHSLA